MRPTACLERRKSRRCVWQHLLLTGLLLGWHSASSQPLGPVITIPIEKVRETYNSIAEDGTRKACGVRLYGEWPAYLNYTNRSSYRIFTPGLQSTASPQSSVAPGGRFRFYCYFNGIDTGRLDAACPTEIGNTLPDWYVEVQRRGPSASFTSRAAPPVLGDFEFVSTSTDPEGDPVIESWNMGDGATRAGARLVHRYTQPGNFVVRLTVTDTDALTNLASRTITVPAPRPSVSIRLLNKHTGNRIELGEEFTARVTVSATDTGVGALSNLVFNVTSNSPVLLVPPIFTNLAAPAQLDIGTLQPGQKREFDWRLRAQSAGQFALVTGGVRGQDAIGRAVSAASAAAEGQVTALIAGIEQRPPRLILGADNNGDGKTNHLDSLVELIVGLTNVSQQDITEVKAVTVNDHPIRLTSLAQDLNIWLTPTNIPAGDYGTIRPGAANAVRSTNVYVAEGRTLAEASILLQGKIGETGVQARGEGVAEVGGERLLEARFDVEDRDYRAGQVVRLFGSLKNVSRFKNNRGEVIDEGKTVGVVIYPTVEGNGIGGYPFPKDSGGRTPDGPTAFLLAPDEEIEIGAIIPTAEVTTNTPLAITYQVVGYVHGEGPKPRRARPGEIEVVEKVTEGWSARHALELLGVPEITDPWLVCPTELSLGGFVSCRFTEGLGNAGGSLVGLAMLTGVGLKEIALGTVRLTGWGLWALEQTLDGLEDPAARARLAREIAIDLAALKQVGAESLQAVELAVDSIGPAIERAIIDTGRTLESGDLKQIAGGMARITGENIDLPLEALIAARTLRKAMLVREGAESAAKQALKESQERAARELGGTVDTYAARGALADLPTSDDLPSGLNVVNEPRVYRDAYGSRKEEVDAYLEVAKEEGLIMGWRSRSPISADKLDAGTHLLKPHGVSIKTSNEIDEKYLNHPPKFLGECVLVEPPIPWVRPWLDKKNKVPTPEFQAAAESYLRRFPDLNLGTEAAEELRAQVYERLAHQLDEWPKQQVNFIKYRREGIDVNFHVEKQKGFGFGEFLLPNQQAKRAARLEADHFVDPFTGQPRKAYRLLMDDGTGKFKPITGDTDFLFMLNPDGTMPSLPKRVRAYSKMIRLGLQHGESFSFSIKKLREGWLRCCTARTAGGEGERMLAVTPHGELLTTMFRDAQSVIDGGPNDALKLGRGRGEFAFLEGTLTEVNTLERTASEAIPKAIRHDVAPMVTISALARMEGELAAEADRNGGQAVRMGPDGLPEIYDAAPAGPAPAPLRTSHRVGGPRLANVDPVEQELLGQLEALAAAGWVNVREVPPPGAAGGQWRPATVEEARGGVAGAGLRLSPYTYLTNDVTAGTSVLPVLPAGEVGWDTRRPLFAVGDQVVIDPGGPGEEFASIASVLPFTLSRPLQHLQEAGTMVLFLSGVAGSDQVPGALPAPENLLVWLRADAGLNLTHGTNVVSWRDQSRNGFLFTAPTEPTRPVWVANSTSGVPAVRFAAASTPRLQGNLGRTLTNATIFTLARWVDASSGSRYVYAFGTRDYSGLMMTLARRNGDGAYHYDGAAERVADDTIPGTGFRVFSQVFGEDGPDRHRLSVDLQRVLDTRTTVGRAYSAVATNVVLGNYVTGNFGFVGDLVEWLVYDRVLSTQERFEVEEYLRVRARLSPFVTPGGLDQSSARVLHYDVPATPEVSWALDAANRQWVQTGAGDPSLVLLDLAQSASVIRTRISASAGSGAMGVVFGYQHPGSFHLFDWRQTATNDVEWGNAPAGMRLRTFHSPAGQRAAAADLWSGPDPTRVTTWRTNAVPWVAGREYDVVLRIGPDETVLEVSHGSTTLETWTVPELKGVGGQFGHYACFLPEARFGPTLFPGTAPVITAIEHDYDGRSTIHWMHGQPPFDIEFTTDLASDAWYPVGPATANYSRTLESTEETLLFRIRGAGLTPDGDPDGGGRSQTFGNGGRLWQVTSTGPTRIEAEDFDEGGEGVGYHDTTSQNQGGVYRNEAVDIGTTTDFGGGHAVGNIAAGEWLEYSIRVEAAGTYRLRVRTARGSSGARSARFLVDGAEVTGLLVIPATGSWASYATVESGPFDLAAGTHILRAVMDGGGFDLNWIEIVPAAPVVQTTFGNNGQPWAIGSTAATRIEAENFDQGGEGTAYHDATPQNAGNLYRAEAVDIGAIEGAEAGHAVSWITAGEWLEYTIRVEQAGEYRLRARTARGSSGTRTVRFLVDGADKTGNLVIPATGNWQSYATVESGRFELTAGTQVLRVDMTSADFNLDWLEIVPVVRPARETFGNNGNPWFIGSTAITRIEAENFDQGGPGIAYLDTDSLNQGGAYRSEDVDIQPTTDTGGGFNVLGIEPGEWLEYTINVEAAGTYQLRFRTSRAPAGSRNLRVLVGGVDKTGLVTIPRTVSWQSWTTVTKSGVSLEAGIQVLRIATEVGGFNLNWIEISP